MKGAEKATALIGSAILAYWFFTEIFKIFGG